MSTDEVSLGRAAEIAGMDRWQFQDVLHERGIPIVIEAQSAARDGRGDCLLFRFLEMIVADTNTVSLLFTKLAAPYNRFSI